MNWQWAKNRWTELRFGFANYLSLAVSFVNLVLLVSLKFDYSGFSLLLLTLAMFIGLSSVSIVLGHVHRLYQQDTDARLTNRAVIEDIVKGVIEELKKE